MFELVERARFSAEFLVIRSARAESGIVLSDFHLDISRDSGEELVNGDTHYDDLIEHPSVTTDGSQSIDSTKRCLYVHELVTIEFTSSLFSR
jgi:hypothetical protein